MLHKYSSLEVMPCSDHTVLEGDSLTADIIDPAAGDSAVNMNSLAPRGSHNLWIQATQGLKADEEGTFPCTQSTVLLLPAHPK
ncbi:hypothetical protein A6R68_17991, partial [Neotoma lepida]